MKKKENIVSYTMEEIKKLKDKTDMKRLRAMREEDIDTSDIPVLDEKFWRFLRIVKPQKKQAVSVRFDPDILAWLRSNGRGYQTTINAVMRAYMESKLSR